MIYFNFFLFYFQGHRVGGAFSQNVVWQILYHKNCFLRVDAVSLWHVNLLILQPDFIHPTSLSVNEYHSAVDICFALYMGWLLTDYIVSSPLNQFVVTLSLASIACYYIQCLFFMEISHHRNVSVKCCIRLNSALIKHVLEIPF